MQHGNTIIPDKFPKLLDYVSAALYNGVAQTKHLSEEEGLRMLANELRAEAIRRNMTISELADRIGVSRETLWRRLKNPGSFKVSEVRAIQETLGMDPEQVCSLFFTKGFVKETRGA